MNITKDRVKVVSILIAGAYLALYFLNYLYQSGVSLSAIAAFVAYIVLMMAFASYFS